MRRIVLLACVVLSMGLTVTPGGAGTSPSTVLSRPGQVVSWTGSLATSDPTGCGELGSIGCDVTRLQVRAAKGAWITIKVSDENLYLRVSSAGQHVGSNGFHLVGTRNQPATNAATVTFGQIRSGLVAYEVGVSSAWVIPGSPEEYRVTAQLAGKAFDRQGDCFVGQGGVEHLRDVDDGAVLPLSVLLVVKPSDVAEVRSKVLPSLVETYSRIGVKVSARVQGFALKNDGDVPFAQVRRAMGGVRPAGVDAVHVLSDDFAGGYADCLGGIAYRELGFSTGSLRYELQGMVPVPTVTAAVIAAHEIGHVLGGQHQQSNCAEALPQQALWPASDGSIGPCTVMSPLGAQVSQTFSTLERATIRAYVRAYAGKA